MDNNYEHIVPWNGANDTGRDVRLKMQRNFERIKANFSELQTGNADILANLDSLVKELANYLRRDRAEATNFMFKMLAGAEFGEAVDSMTAGKGTIITADGRIQTNRMEIRNSLVVMEYVLNRIQAMEADYSFSECGVIESVQLMPDGTYRLTLKKRFEGDFTAFQVNDILYGIFNKVGATLTYITSWLRVVNVDTASNTIDATMYADAEVPGGKNYAPLELMLLTHRGNPVDAGRQAYWYLSSCEHCICMLDGVTKPILEESNYSIIVGRLKHLSIFTNLPINYQQSYVYCRGIATQDLFKIDYQGNPVRLENNRGKWSMVDAQKKPYQSAANVYDAVYHCGCKWMCLVTGSIQDPKYGCTDWAMIEGNPDFAIDVYSTKGLSFDAENFETTLVVTGRLYNQDVTSHLQDADVSWSRDTGDPTEDNAWTIAHAGAGKTLPLTFQDLGPKYTELSGCIFTATALLRDGQTTYNAEPFDVIF